jgi:F-type H+-transporting ATPase subunit a
MNPRNYAVFTIILIVGLVIVGAVIEGLTPGASSHTAHGEGQPADEGWQAKLSHYTQGHETSPLTILFFFLLVAALLVVLSLKATRHLELRPRPWQNLAEQVVEAFDYMATSVIGPHGRKYGSLLGTCFLFILFMNLLGLVPFCKSPTASLNVTVSLAITSVLLVHIYSIREVGIKKYLLHYWGEPWWLGPLMFPLHVIGELAKPLSLSIRLFGNIFGEDMIIIILMALGAFLLPVFLPIPVQLPLMGFAIFTGFVQALVFTMLIAAYIENFAGEVH